MSRKKPVMLGAHVPKKPGRRSNRGVSVAGAREVNAAFNAWARKQGRTHLVYELATFAR